MHERLEYAGWGKTCRIQFEPMFERYLKRWNLTMDGDSFSSQSGHLLPVRQHGVAAMLKISSEAEELAGNRLMVWWKGNGAAPVLAHDGEALLMVRAQGSASLAQMAIGGTTAT